MQLIADTEFTQVNWDLFPDVHMLLWIKNALAPQEIRDRLLDPSSDFQKDDRVSRKRAHG